MIDQNLANALQAKNNKVVNGGPGSGVKGHQTEKKPIPGLSQWNMYAGGTSAAEGKNAYDYYHNGGHVNAQQGGKQYMINPISSNSGYHRGYSLQVFPSTRGGGYAEIDKNGDENSNQFHSPNFRTPHEAVHAARAHLLKADAEDSLRKGAKDQLDRGAEEQLNRSAEEYRMASAMK